jgi:hypothetical protein
MEKHENWILHWLGWRCAVVVLIASVALFVTAYVG